jgi:hypothetical protein
LHAIGDNFGCVALLAVFILPFTGPQAALDVDLTAFF